MSDLGPFWLSIRVASLATVLIVAVGLPAALGLARLRFPGKGLVAGILVLPLVLPPTVLGYYLLQLLGRRAPVGYWLEHVLGIMLVFHWSGAVVASAVAAFPLFLLPARGAFEAVDPALEDVARLLGPARALGLPGGNASPGLARARRRDRAGVCPSPGRLRRDLDGRRQHSRRDADGRAGDLRRGAGQRRGSRRLADSVDLGSVDRGALGRSAHAAGARAHAVTGSDRAILDVALVHRVHPGLALDLSLRLGREIGVVFGPSGAGKTTLLRLIAGLRRADKGYVRLEDEALFDAASKINRPLRCRRIGMIFQDDCLFPHLDVAANIRFGLKGWRASRRRRGWPRWPRFAAWSTCSNAGPRPSPAASGSGSAWRAPGATTSAVALRRAGLRPRPGQPACAPGTASCRAARRENSDALRHPQPRRGHRSGLAAVSAGKRPNRRRRPAAGRAERGPRPLR